MGGSLSALQQSAAAQATAATAGLASELVNERRAFLLVERPAQETLAAFSVKRLGSTTTAPAPGSPRMVAVASEPWWVPIDPS